MDIERGLYFDELKSLGAEIVIGSVADVNLVNKLTNGFQVVYHLAAAFRKVNLPKTIYWDVNVEGTRNVMEAALKCGVRKFVYCSTCGVHGNVEQEVADEDAPIAPKDYYQYTKFEGEKVVSEFRKNGLKIVTLRPTAIYGPGDPERFFNLFKMPKRLAQAGPRDDADQRRQLNCTAGNRSPPAARCRRGH